MNDEPTQCSKKQQANAINLALNDQRNALIVETICINNRILKMNEKLLDSLINPIASITEDDL